MDKRLRNELLFRDANEAIRRAQDELGISVELLPFLCECFRTTCRTIVQLSRPEYESVRSNRRRFLIAPDHDAEDGTLVERGDRFWVLEKEI